MSPVRRRREPPGPFTVVGISLGALAAATFAVVAFGALAPALQTEFGFSNAEIGLLVALVFLGAGATSVPAGRLTDRVGPALVLGWSLGLFTVAMAVVAVAPTVAVFLTAVTIGGLVYGGVNPPTNVLVAGRMRFRLGFFLSVKQSGVPLGGLLAGVVLPPVAVATSWRWAMLVAVGVCGVVAALTPLLRGAGVTGGRGHAHEARSPLGARETAALGLFGFAMSGTQWSVFAHLTLFLTEDRGFSLALAGLGLGLAQGLGAGSRVLWGWLSDIPGRRLFILMTLAVLSVTSLVALGSGVDGPALWVVLGAAGVVIVGWNGAYYALIADRAGAAGLGRASANALIFIFAGSVFMPPVLGLTVDLTDSWEVFWLTASALVAVAGVGLWLGLRGGRRQANRTPG